MTNRRTFLKITAGTAALAAVNPVAFADCGECKKTPIGIQLYAVRGEFMKDMDGTLKTLADLGYNGVEFWGYQGTPEVHGKTPEEMKALLDKHGLVCAGIHCGRKALEDAQLETTVAVNKTLGNDFLIIAASGSDMHSAEGAKKFAAFLNEQAEKVADAGMRVGYHAHGFDFNKVGENGESAWEVLFSNTNPEVIQQLDVGNCAGGGGDPVAMLKKFPGTCASLHIKEHPNAPLGETEIDWDEIFEVLDKQGKTEWYVVEQGERAAGFDAATQAIKALKKMGR